jgi:transcriptional regulator with XRE-family HTH domain
MKDRIQQIIDYKGISPGDLAELLEVQRSNISHILNGRNKPGAVFIEKLLQAFPDVNARWLLTGEGIMVLKDSKGDLHNAVKQSHEDLTAKQAPHLSHLSAKTSTSTGKGKIIENIVLLYSDGTFTYYNNI